MKLGKAIESLRKQNGIKRIDFAKEIGISASYLSQIEKGTIPSLRVLNSIANFYKVPLSILFWFGIEDSDILDEKRDMFKYFKIPITSMMEDLINTEQITLKF